MRRSNKKLENNGLPHEPGREVEVGVGRAGLNMQEPPSKLGVGVNIGGES